MCCHLARRVPFLSWVRCPRHGFPALVTVGLKCVTAAVEHVLLCGGSEWVPEPQPPGGELGPVQWGDRSAVPGRARWRAGPLAGAPTPYVPEQDPGGTEERALRGRAQHPAPAAAHLQPPRAGGAPAPRVVLHRGAPALPLGFPRPHGARAGLLEGERPGQWRMRGPGRAASPAKGPTSSGPSGSAFLVQGPGKPRWRGLRGPPGDLGGASTWGMSVPGCHTSAQCHLSAASSTPAATRSDQMPSFLSERWGNRGAPCPAVGRT